MILSFGVCVLSTCDCRAVSRPHLVTFVYPCNLPSLNLNMASPHSSTIEDLSLLPFTLEVSI